MYRCRHRGQGCQQPARTNTGLTRAGVLGLKLLGQDERLQAAIRRNLAPGGRPETPGARRRQGPTPAETLRALTEKRRKLLELHYNDRISAEGFAEEERTRSDVEVRFEEVAAVLRDLDIETVWNAAEEQERRILVEELIQWVSVFPDHLQVTVSGAPPLHVLYREVGLKQSDSVGVGGGTRNNALRAFDALPVWGPSRGGEGIRSNDMREIGITELCLPAA